MPGNTLPNGYTLTTTFMMDFDIADRFGASAIKDTYNRAFKEWKSNYVYLTELTIALNLHMWRHHNAGHMTTAKLYQDLFLKADEYATSHLKGEELAFYYRVTD